MPTLDELRRFLASVFPQCTVAVEETGEGRARVRQPIGEEHLRPGGTVSGPTMMAVADAASYLAVLSRVGIVPLAVTSHLGIHFLRRPRPGKDIVGDARVLKLGRTLAVVEVQVFSEGDPEMVAHATVTYALPPGAIPGEPPLEPATPQK
jgi:uncharacterized protein (TIGR00369 family)